MQTVHFSDDDIKTVSSRQILKRPSDRTIRNKGSKDEMMMLVPKQGLPRVKMVAKPQPRKMLSSADFYGLGQLSLFTSQADLGVSESLVQSPIQTVYLAACRQECVTPSRHVWRQLLTSSICLQNHPIELRGIKALAVTLVDCDMVTRLDLHHCQLEQDGLRYILESTSLNKSIKYLKVSGNHLKTTGAIQLGRFLASNKTLLELDAADNSFEDDDIKYLASGLKVNSTLVSLVLSRNGLRENGGICLGKAIAENRSLQELDLSWNHLRHKGAVHIANSLQTNSSLRVLNLAWNGFGLDGCYAMAKALKRNRTLTELNLTSNRINFRAFTFLLAGLSPNTTLQVLKVGKNPITCQGAVGILKIILEQSIKIQELDLTDIPVNKQFESILDKIKKQSAHFRVVHGQLVSKVDRKLDTKPDVLNTDDPLLLLFEYTKLRNLRLIDLFNSLDKDRSDGLTRDEFKDGLKSTGLSLSSWSLDVLMDKLDINKDGLVNFEELIQGQKNYNRKITKRRQAGLLDLEMPLSEILKDKLRRPKIPVTPPRQLERMRDNVSMRPTS